ncbi:MAG: LacI family DNA-binding transcriptional regulator [Caldilineaceae bacterium]|nr:LacI family DNA-binding transcriptional regulator [Caldilineaceae bacterium]
MPTVKDVAEHARVSVATVSRTLSGYPHVSQAARERVLKAVEELHYRPDQVARSLRRRRSNLIGLVVSTIENVFFTELARAAEQSAREFGYNLILCNTDENPQQEATYLGILDQQLVAGVILAPAPGNAGHLKPFIESGLPIVLVNRRLDHVSCISITSDDEEAAFQCTRHLIALGQRRIAAVTGLADVFTTNERLAGYRRALEEANIPFDPALVVSGLASLKGGYEAAGQLMQRVDPPDAIFAFNNVMTQGVIIALQEAGIRWPDQMDVAGFGAFEHAHLYRPPLTLVRQPTREMGRKAVEMLLQQMENGPSENGDWPQIVLHNQLILGDLQFAQRDG